jgi:NitT/TauT family transport system substrate-binding protein
LALTNTAHVAKEGLSTVTPEKLKKTIDSVVSAYELPNNPDPASVYTERYLPPAAERMLR